MKSPATNDPATLFPSLPFQAYKVVLVVDLVESVRLMAGHEAAVVARWSAFMDGAAQRILPKHKGHLVKSLGDGLLATFDEAVDAVRTAMEMHTFFAPLNHTLPADQRLYLRVGINASHLYVGEYDVYGHGVNLAARVANLGEAGEIVVTAPVRDGIVDGVDGELEDMGESHLKHWPGPVRTWRVYPLQGQPSEWPEKRKTPAADFQPPVTVIAFDARTLAHEHTAIGELIADSVIARLARSPDTRTIAHLSSPALRAQITAPGEMNAQPSAAFVLSGGYAVVDHRVLITAELVDTRSGEVVWVERIDSDTLGLMQAHSELVLRLSNACAHALLNAAGKSNPVLPP